MNYEDPYSDYTDEPLLIPRVSDLRLTLADKVLVISTYMASLASMVGAGGWTYRNISPITSEIAQRYLDPSTYRTFGEVAFNGASSYVVGFIAGGLTLGVTISGIALTQVLTGRDFVSRRRQDFTDNEY